MEETSAFTPPPPPSTAATVDRSSTSDSSPQLVTQTAAPPVLVRQRSSMPYRVMHVPRPTPTVFDYISSPDDLAADDTLSCVILILTFWFFVSMTLIMGIFGPDDLQTGPYSSILLQPNPLFAQSLKVENLKELKMAPVLYGFYKAPPLSITKTWSETLNALVKPESHKKWVYFLNKGSQLNITYNVTSSSSLLLVIAKGVEEMVEWIEDPSYPRGTLSWNVIHGNGNIVQEVTKSTDYYVAVGNLNLEDAEVKLHLSVRSSMYDTTNSFFKCDFTRGSCSLKIPFSGSTAAVLTTPGPREGGDEVYVRVTYEPRWLTYCICIGGMSLIMVWGFRLVKGLRGNDGDGVESTRVGPDRAPLLSHKDDDISSLGSSYDSGSENDEPEEYLEDGPGAGAKKHKARQCVICFDASKDCFYIPCGHNASCFACGTRIVEEAGICPICRRKIKKVRKIYNV
ncbi:hypothetical protein RND81_08G155500 [Saponaria officinalis]|uniref:RING-type domain-containing protein n=1 Tax=Saponaria officinalis TaxID=3572 RepID=A0AAW1J6Z1_SAPOF